jgi:hypothetical protein
MNASVTHTTFAKNLSKEPPRSPRQRLGGYSILGRTLDKCRADLEGQLGEYHYNCPLDQMLFQFKGIESEDFKRSVSEGLSDQEMLQWINMHGKPRSRHEIQRWSQEVEKSSLIDNPDKKEYFITECKKLGLDPQTTTLFEWLEADDRETFKTP